jgi:hypothetical protein
MMKRVSCLLAILVLSLAIFPFVANVKAENFTLNIDDVSIASFTGNLARLSLKAHADGAGNLSLFLLLKSYDSYPTANWFCVPKEHDNSRNITYFSIDVIIPLMSQGSFPQDNYTFICFLGTDYTFDNTAYGFGWLSLPFANYEGFWTLTYFGNFSDIQEEMEMPFPGTNPSEFGNSWCKLTLIIRHVKGFTEYADTLVNKIPWLLLCLGTVVLIIPILTIIDAISQRRRESSRANAIENIAVPVCIAVLLFIPVFQLSIQPIKQPFSIIPQDSFIFIVFILYGVVLLVSIIVRLLIRHNDFSSNHVNS